MGFAFFVGKYSTYIEHSAVQTHITCYILITAQRATHDVHRAGVL